VKNVQRFAEDFRKILPREAILSVRIKKYVALGNPASSRPSGLLDPLESGSAGWMACPTVKVLLVILLAADQ
jgi:hypothetical protein